MPAVLIQHRHLYAVFQQVVEVAVGIDGQLPRTVLHQQLYGLGVGIYRQARIKPLQRGAQPPGEYHLMRTIAPLGALWAKGFSKQIGVRPAQRFQQMNGGLLHQFNLAITGADFPH